MLTMLVAAATFKFAGGPIADLANQVSAETGKPVVFLYVAEPKVRAATFGWETPKDVVNNLRNFYSFTLTGSEAIGLGPRIAPPNLLDRSAAFSRIPGPSLVLEDGSVTVKAEAGKYSLFGEIVPRVHSGPLTIHWTLREMPIVLSATKAPAAEVLEASVAAVGGKVAENRIDPVWPTLRERLIGGYDGLAKATADRATAARYSLAAQYLRNLPESELIKLYASESGTATFRADRSSPFYSTAWTALRAAYSSAMAASRNKPQDPPVQGGPPPQPVRVPLNGVLERASSVDPRQPVDVTFTVQKGVSLSFLAETGRPVLTIP